MKQNIFGVILFSVIVGTAVYISASFIKLPIPPAVEEKPFVIESKTGCGKRVYKVSATGTAKINVNQAVLNPKTNQLNTSLSVERTDLATENIWVTYHFFVKEGRTSRYLGSETAGIKPNFGSGKFAAHEINSSYYWLKNLDSQENIYLLAESSRSPFARDGKSIPRFDEASAVPVLLMKEK